MDIKSILPFLLSGNKSASLGKDSSGATSTLLSSLLSADKSSISPDLITSALNGGASQAYPSGITPIISFVSDDLLGKMIKYLNRN